MDFDVRAQQIRIFRLYTLTYNLFQINHVQNVNFIAKKIHVLNGLSDMTTFF